ncbi:SGNH/GDSL hydrolase family protein [uncultured Microscilla sp.]|uniref:SGNH/GDSL hydrolase family protein n=1 Tax=uncultured Microscilla sp. TaxID=432653 RepID=UPI002615DA0E|nr:SGNH/GDSL hydrolase family protein [uncultured Microscilla sp.]
MTQSLPFYLLLLWLTACGSTPNTNNSTDTVAQNAVPAPDTMTVSKKLTDENMQTNETNLTNDTTTCQEGDTLIIQEVKTLCLKNSLQKLTKLKLALQKGEALKMVCFGNSITNGYKVGSYGVVANPYPYVLERLLKKKYPKAKLKIVKEGHNGWRSDQAVKEVDTLVLAKKPDWVTLMFGINDAYAGWTPKFFGQKMESLVKQLKAQDIEVIIFTPTPFTTAYNQKAIAYLPILKALAKQYDCVFINLHQAILARIQKDKLELDKVLPDEVHFGDEYYQLIAEEIFRVFDQ